MHPSCLALLEWLKGIWKGGFIVVNDIYGSAARAHVVKEYHDSATPWWETDTRTIGRCVCS
jgi:hypothetical protein